MLRRIKLFIILALCPSLPVWAAPHTADLGSAPVVHGNISRDFARITFEWPIAVRFNADAEGKMVTIHFERKANPDFAVLLKQLYPYVTHAERKADGKTIVLWLDKPYKIRTFASETISGLDLVGVDPKRQMALLAPESSLLSRLAPAAGDEEKSKEAAGDSHPISPDQAKAIPVDKSKVSVVVSASADSATLRFPFAERTGATVFVRAHTLWIVFNQKVTLDLDSFSSLPKTVFTSPSVVPHAQATILRVPVDDSVNASVTREENSFEWAVLLTPTKRPLVTASKIEVNTEPPAPANVAVSALEMADPITVADPIIKDELIITPLYSTGEGVSQRRDFVEFNLLPTAQGIVVVKRSDEVQVSPTRNGLRVSTPQGASLSPAVPIPEENLKTEKVAHNDATLFPYELWKPDNPEKPGKEIRELMHRIVEAKNDQESNEARLRLAEIYLSQGLAPEANGVLDGINRTNPVFYRSAKLNALHGAANFLMYRFTEAARDFRASELNENREVAYWRNMLADLLGSSDQSYDYLALNPDYISKYPPIFRQRLAIVAADRAIGNKEYNIALKIFDTLQKENLLDQINVYITFLLAKISADTGQEKEALVAWDRLAVDYRHPFVQARAEFTRIVWGLDHGTLTKDKAAERLERLRLGWHGDGLELKVLTMLGELYAERKDYVNAMRIWNNAVTTFANTAEAIDMARKMQEAFITMFNEGAADSLPPLEALALYYQYRNYTPPGTTGIAMIDRLADRLMAVDLLDQAATLLDHQMHTKVEKEQRSQVGVKLATVHLLNHQPKKALQALQDSVYGENPALLRQLRNRLAAQSLADLGQNEKALQTLGQDDTDDAERIRINIYWQAKDYTKVITSVEQVLKSRKDITAPITLDESEYLLRLALSYVFQNNAEQLQYLRDYFGPLMANNPNKAVFDFITTKDITPNPGNFEDVMKYLASTRSFIDNYKARIQVAGLDSILPKKTTK